MRRVVWSWYAWWNSKSSNVCGSLVAQQRMEDAKRRTRLALASHSSVETSSVANVRKRVGGRPPVSSSAGYLLLG